MSEAKNRMEKEISKQYLESQLELKNKKDEA